MSLIINNIEKIIEDKNISTRQFEQDTGISNGTIGKAIKNKSSIQSKFVESIIQTYRINPIWFLLGTGEMYMDNENLSDISSNVSSNVSSNIEGTEALHSCQNEVSRLEGLLAEKEELIKELRARITDKEDMVSMLKNQLKAHESTQNERNESDTIRQTG